MIEFRVRKGEHREAREDEDDAINICNCCYRQDSTGTRQDRIGRNADNSMI